MLGTVYNPFYILVGIDMCAQCPKILRLLYLNKSLIVSVFPVLIVMMLCLFMIKNKSQVFRPWHGKRGRGKRGGKGGLAPLAKLRASRLVDPAQGSGLSRDRERG